LREQVLNTSQACEYLGISKTHFYNNTKSILVELGLVYFTAGERLRVRISDLDKLLDLAKKGEVKI